jgi:hypothetical protein
VEDLLAVIGADRVLELAFSSLGGELEVELWSATLKQVEFDDDDEVRRETVLATASLARVDLYCQWLEALDAESADLEAVGGAFIDRERLSLVDEESLFAESLVIIDYVEVPEEHRGARLSHALVRGVGRVFRSDIVALTPARISRGGSDDLMEDIVKFEGLCRHWARTGFVRVPDTDVMLLPMERR